MNEGWDFTSIESLSAKVAAISVLVGMSYTIYKNVKKNILKVIETVDIIHHIKDELAVDKTGNLRDIITQIENRQIRLEERERAFLHTHPNIIFELDENNNLIWCNKSFLDSFDVDTDVVLNKGWFNLIVEEERIKIESLFSASQLASRNLTTVCNFHKIINDTVISTKVTLLATAILNKEKQCSGFLVTIKK